MTFFIAFLTIIQNFSISLGVGSSTLAIINFFAAIADGKIDETERRMMGIVYVVLRVAMVLILLTSLFLIFNEYDSVGFQKLSVISFGQSFALIILFINALLMTFHLIPSTFGPAIQAGSWYTLGTISALQILGYTNFSFLQFTLGYVTWIILAIGIVNGIMAILKSRRENL